MPPARSVLALSALAVVLAGLPALATHAYGSCPPTPTEVCERWSVVHDDDSAVAPARSDQFGVAVLTTPDVVVAVSKNVALNTEDPYASEATMLVRGYAPGDGRQLWSTTYADRDYVNVTAATLSPDGTTAYITGGAYNGFPVGATDSQVMTVALRTSDGAQLWAAHWDARPDGTDNGKAVVVSPDGTEVYVAGITTSPLGDLDYVTVAYSAVDGSELWSAVYTGPKERGTDAVFGLAVNPVHDLLYVTGWSDGVVEYDADYATVAYALGSTQVDGPGKGRGKGRGKGKPHEDTDGPVAGSIAWVARYDGLGLNKSERANAVAVSPDGASVYVTGDSYSGPGGGDYGFATVAYDAVTGAQRWAARYDGAGGFHSASQVVATADRVVVTGQARAADAAEGNDVVTVGYDTAGRQLWTATVAPLRSEDYPRDVALSPDGATLHLVSTSIPKVNYTSLARLGVSAYSVSDGALRWSSTVTAGGLDALRGAAVSADAQTVSVLGDQTRSADPLGPPSQDIYDSVVLAFDTQP